jgi:hypothetical protein
VHIEVTERQEVANPCLPLESNPLVRRFVHIPRLPEKVTREFMGLGTRILMDAQGHIFTNHHVADGATKVEVVLANGFRYAARRFCQVVEAEALIKRAGASPQSYLSFRRPAPYLSLRPNSRIASASLDDSRPLRANAVWVGSVGQWAHRQTENAGHAPGI